MIQLVICLILPCVRDAGPPTPISGGALAPGLSHSAPSWSWDTVQLHAHCSNTSATPAQPFRDDVAAWMYTDFDIISDHLSGTSGLCATPHTPRTVLYLVAMFIGC